MFLLQDAFLDVFNAINVSDSGLLSRAELTAALGVNTTLQQLVRTGTGPDSADRLFSEIDRGQEGWIRLSEFQQYFRGHLASRR